MSTGTSTHSNNRVNITISESGGSPPSITIALDNEPFDLNQLGTGPQPGAGAPIQWHISGQSAAGWSFSSAGGIDIPSGGNNFADDGPQGGGYRVWQWKRKVADNIKYPYSISLTKTVNNSPTLTLIIDPTIINQP